MFYNIVWRGLSEIDLSCSELFIKLLIFLFTSCTKYRSWHAWNL